MNRTLKYLGLALGALALVAVAGSPAYAQKKTEGKSGTTLAASKTLDICTVSDPNDTPDNPLDDIWRYSGEVSVWNEGAVDTMGLIVNDWIQNKTVGQFKDQYQALYQVGPEIQAGTTLETATVFPYSIDAAALAGDIRNRVKVTITNHSGSLGTPTGPEPKATYSGDFPPPACANDSGCTYTQGYWGNKPGVEWPAGFNRTDPFFNSGLTWQNLLDASAGGNGYVILAKQYIAAVLNQANGAPVPSGVQDIIDLSTNFFTSSGSPSAACPTNSSCGTQKTWGGILDSYNKGEYPGGPEHCSDDSE